jgi:hypothetical protein
LVFFIVTQIAVITQNNGSIRIICYTVFTILRQWIMIPMAIVLFCRTKSIFAGCVFAVYSLDQLVGGFIMNTIVDMLAGADGQWVPGLNTFVMFVFMALLAIDCFASKKLMLRKVRWLFIVLPVLLPPVMMFQSIIGYAMSGSSLDIMPINVIAQLLTSCITVLPYLLIGLAFFFSYPKRQAAPSFHCCRACGQPLDDTAKFCTACGNSAD